jgi:DNA-binding MarR family transcriptional regulator
MITRKDFDIGNFKKRNYDRTKHPVYLFLQRHKGSAYTPLEIAKYLKINKWTVRSIIRKLKAENLIDHRPPFVSCKKSNKKKKSKR